MLAARTAPSPISTFEEVTDTKPESFVKSEVFVGKDKLVIKPESFVKSEVFVGRDELVIKPESLVISEVFVGTIIFAVLLVAEFAVKV